MIKIGKRAALSVAVVMLGTIVGVIAAPSAAMANCTINANTPYKSGNLIIAGGWTQGCGSGYRVRIERSRWFGWESLVSSDIPTDGSAVLHYNCAGNGTHTYRTVVYQASPSATSSTFTTSC